MMLDVLTRNKCGERKIDCNAFFDGGCPSRSSKCFISTVRNAIQGKKPRSVASSGITDLRTLLLWLSLTRVLNA